MLALWTGIPVYKLTEEETAKLLRMEDELHKRIIGQDDAIKAVSQAIRRTRAGLKDPKRPSGSFIFLGPSGVGKTETAKTLAEFLFGDEASMIQLDMSEYMEKHTVSRLVGSPPGYVGYDEGGQLTEAVRRKPFSVVLFDEIEKAHPDVFNALLQILEDGRLTDAQGRTVDFKNTVIIMTSNLGTADLRKATLGFARADEHVTYEKMKEKVHDELKRHFRPEFLNRIDEVIVFHELSTEEITEIVDLLIKRVPAQLEAQGLGFELTHRRRSCCSPRRATTRRSAPGRCAGRSSGMVEDPLVGEDPVEGVPRRRDDRRRRRGRRDRLPHRRRRRGAGRAAAARRARGIRPARVADSDPRQRPAIIDGLWRGSGACRRRSSASSSSSRAATSTRASTSTMHDDGSGTLQSTITFDADAVAADGRRGRARADRAARPTCAPRAGRSRRGPYGDGRHRGGHALASVRRPARSRAAHPRPRGPARHPAEPEARARPRLVQLARRGERRGRRALAGRRHRERPRAVGAPARGRAPTPPSSRRVLAVQLKSALHVSVMHPSAGRRDEALRRPGEREELPGQRGWADWDQVVKFGIGVALALLAGLFFLAATVGIRRNRRRAAQRTARGPEPERVPLM